MSVIGPGADLDGDVLDRVDLSGVRAPDVSMVDCELTGCVLDGAVLDGLRLVDTTIAEASGSVLRSLGGVWRDSEWRGCRFGALDASSAKLTRVEFVDCKIDLLNLAGADLTDVTLTRVRIGELALGDASGKGVKLVDCTVGVLELHNTRIDPLDISGSTLTDEVRGLNGLRGVVLSERQCLDLAPAMARFLGARLEGDRRRR